MEALAEVWPVGEERLRSHLARFLFKGDDVHARVGVLSGGERARLALARLLAEAPNLLVLDEPTNHLDIAAQEALEDVLLGYEGTLLFVSHDRRLISKLAKELWVLEAGAVSVFSATYEEWEAARVATERAAKEERAAVRSAPKAPRPPQPRNKPREEEQAAKRVAQAEERLKAIEQQLAAASEGRDIEAIAKLGGEYRTAQGEVERAMSEWEKAASG
jgi:ATP-binding cassette subfamily F protein 3